MNAIREIEFLNKIIGLMEQDMKGTSPFLGNQIIFTIKGRIAELAEETNAESRNLEGLPF